VMTDGPSRDVVVQRLDRIQDLLAQMRDIGVPAAEQLRDDLVTRYALERLATLIVDAATALNSHITSRLIQRVATTYAESFDLVAEAGVLEHAFARRIRTSAKLRNLLIHDYADIDYEVLSSTLSQLIDDYETYRRQVARWLKDSTDD